MFAGILFGAVAGVLLIVALIVGWQRTFPSTRIGMKPQAPSLPVSTPRVRLTAAPEAHATNTALLLRLRDAETWEEVLVVMDGTTRSIPLPSDVDRSTAPVTDGKRVYAHVARPEGRKIVAFSFAGKEEEIITDSTPLVQPRGLIASPNGAFIAFFLDDRGDRKEPKTELWIYDTATRTKRVSVEHLSQTDISGPFFVADGSFLLRSGEQLLAGSPRRTGVDILRVPFQDAHIRWDAGAARSPDGERVVLVDETGDERTTVRRVLEYQSSSSQPRIRFSRAGSELRILGWNERDQLFVLANAPRGAFRGTNGEQPTLWILTGENNASRPLGPSVSAPLLAGDGSAVGVVNAEDGRATLAIQETGGAAKQTLTALPAPTSSSPTSAPRGRRSPVASPVPAASSSLRLVQLLRVASIAGATAPPRLSLAPSVVLPYLVTHIRELTDAPHGESAAPERVWVLGTPNAVYMDYRIGSTLWRRLIQLEEREGVIVRATAIGVYTPVEGEWVLVRGESVPDPAPIQLYEFETDIQQWIEKPLAQDVLP